MPPAPAWWDVLTKFVSKQWNRFSSRASTQVACTSTQAEQRMLTDDDKRFIASQITRLTFNMAAVIAVAGAILYWVW